MNLSNLRTDHLSVGSRFMKVFAEHYFALAIMGNLKGGLSPLSLGIKGHNARYLREVKEKRPLPPSNNQRVIQ